MRSLTSAGLGQNPREKSDTESKSKILGEQAELIDISQLTD